MTTSDARQTIAGNAATRQLICVHCGAPFECALDGTCWCANEAVRLPMPAAGGDCLCPGCLRDAARLRGNTKTEI
ncbi:MAG: hypothetical protein JWN71_2755 [Xanthobacteraceae bacterium]|jgi:hypothetical protein|nr:hypothetical protein [Xanthobacteraceae bacterium]